MQRFVTCGCGTSLLDPDASDPDLACPGCGTDLYDMVNPPPLLLVDGLLPLAAAMRRDLKPRARRFHAHLRGHVAYPIVHPNAPIGLDEAEESVAIAARE